MASIASCPRCTSNLKIPVGAFAESRARCPVCGAEFQVSEAPVQALPEALVIAAAPQSEPSQPEPLEPVQTESVEIGSANERQESASEEASIEEASIEEGTTREHVDKPTLSSLLGRQEPAEATPPAEEAEAEVAQSGETGSKAAQPAEAQQSLEELLAIWRSEDEQPQSEVADAEAMAKDVESSQRETVATTTEAPRAAMRAAGLLRSPFGESEQEVTNPADPAEVADRKEAMRTPAGEVDRSLKETGQLAGDGVLPAPGQDAESIAAESIAAESIAGESIAGEREAPVASSNELDFSPEESSASRRGVRKLAGAAVVAMACVYGLAWVGGPSADLLQMAQWAPPGMLPPSFREQPAVAETTNSEATSESTAEAAETTANPVPQSKPSGSVADEEFLNSGAAAMLAENSSATKPKARVDPAVVPATAESPVESVAPVKDMISLLRNPRRVSAEQLAKTLASAEQAAADLLVGDLTEQASISRMGQAYMAAAKLAEEAALIDRSDAAGNRGGQRAAARQLFERILTDAQNRNEMAQITARWIEYAERPSPGILLSGTIQDVRTAGRLTEYVVEVQWPNGSATVPVLMPPAAFTTGNPVAVAGLVVADPRKNVQDYGGESPQVVLADYVFMLPATGQ